MNQNEIKWPTIITMKAQVDDGYFKSANCLPLIIPPARKKKPIIGPFFL